MIISRTPLGRILKSSGRPPSPVSTEKIIDLYNQGKSCNEISQLLGSNYTVIWRRLKPLGLLRDRGAGSRGKNFSASHCLAISNGRKELLSKPEEKERLCIGKNNPFWGKRHKPETIQAMKLKLSILLSGENNPQWQGGKSFESYTSEFKRIIRHLVYHRDNYKCQECGVVYKPNSSKLVAHHKDADKKNCSLTNLITLCRPCHGKITMEARWKEEVLIR